jgi:hypothetical protein
MLIFIEKKYHYYDVCRKTYKYFQYNNPGNYFNSWLECNNLFLNIVFQNNRKICASRSDEKGCQGCLVLWKMKQIEL